MANLTFAITILLQTLQIATGYTFCTQDLNTMTDRKARLAALAAKAGRNQKPMAVQESTEKKEEDKEPSDNTAEQPVTKRQRLDENNNEKVVTVTKESLVKTSDEISPLEVALKEAEKKQSKVDAANAAAGVGNGMGNIAPTKANWDLRRDIEKKLEKLERRTQRAIVEMLRARLEKEANEDLD